MKNRLIWIVFIALLIVAAIVYFSNKTGTIKPELRDFRVEDTASVTRIFMADKMNQKVLLEKIDGKWVVNGKFPARMDAVTVLLKTLNRLDVKAPVSQAAVENVIKQIAGKSIKVEVYKGDELIKTIYVGGPTQDQQGTYMILEGSSVPFVIHIPGFSGYLSSRFFITEREWRDNAVFSFSYKEIASVMVSTVWAPDMAFTISSKAGQAFSVSDIKGNPVTDFDSMIVREYIARFRNVKYESLLPEFSPTRLDSLKKANPMAILRVTDTKGNIQQIVTYYMPNSQGIVGDDNQLLPNDPERMYGIINDGKDVVSCQFYVFDPLLKDLSFFKRKPV